LRELTAVSTVPVLSGYDQFIGSGTIGGYMYSIEEQAELAVRNALRILRGEPASAIPIVAGAGNHFIFDYLALQRWDIPLSALPPDSIIENRPPSFWETYQREIIAIGILIVCLILLILLLILVIRQLTKTRLDLSNLNANLENQVSQRTLELSAANSALMDEMLERKRAEEALRENETNLKALMNATEESMFLIENNGVIISLNETTATRLKSTTAEMLGHNIYDYLPPETSAHRKHMFSQAIETGQYLRFEDERLGALIENHVYPILDPCGQVTRLAIYGSDITERKRIERALHESNLRLRMALDAAKIGIHEWDVQANQLSWDERMYAFWEIQPDMPLSYELFIQGVHEDDRSRVAASIAQLTEPGSSGMHNIEYRVIGTQTGVERWLQLNGQMLFEEGRPVRLLGTAIDITEHKKIEQAEREQRTMAEALRDTSRALNSTLDFDSVLEEILKNVGRVVPIISANIALLDECGNLHFVRFLGYEEHPILEEELKTIGFSMEKSAIYKTVYETGQPMIIPDTHADPRWVSIQPGDWIRSFAVLPFCVKNQVVGFLNLDSPTLGMYTAEHIQNLQAFADQAALAIENARLYADVQELAITDTLTGLLNRRGLFQLGEREVERAIRFQHPLTLLIFDIDHFKLINDTYGHLLGDRILCAMAKCCQTVVRTVDIVTRYGGDEFILLLPETDLENGVFVAERLRKTVEQMTLSVETDENTNGKTTRVTISLGVSAVTQNSDSIQSIISRADQALYSAKQSGRNRVVAG
jgi:diguanylate cyclase (GGDEF)-like protein/PAS domain S-box-containing protein